MYIHTPRSEYYVSPNETTPGPSADPAMWAGSFLAQREAQEMALARQWDDVDMEQADYMSKHHEYERSTSASGCSDIMGKRFLTLDTNVLINHLDLVRKTFIALSSAGSEASLLVPTVVINELDSLASPRSYDPSTSSSVQPLISSPTLTRARQATSWLLSINRAKRESPSAPQAIRCQRWSERSQADMRKADDRVLDCCLTFRKMGAKEVILWTEDRNLSLLAEANDIPTVPSPTPALGRILRICGMDDDHVILDEDVLPLDEDMKIYNDQSEVRINHEPDDMQIEPDFETETYTSSTSTTTGRTPRSLAADLIFPETGINDPSPLFPPSRHPRRTRPPIPTDILARLSHIANLILSYLSPSPTHHPEASLALSSLITALDSLPPRSSVDDTRTFYMLLSALMTLQDWIRGHEGGQADQKGKEVRSGEAADALRRVYECLPVVLPRECVEYGEWWTMLERDIRAL